MDSSFVRIDYWCGNTLLITIYKGEIYQFTKTHQSRWKVVFVEERGLAGFREERLEKGQIFINCRLRIASEKGKESMNQLRMRIVNRRRRYRRIAQGVMNKMNDEMNRGELRNGIHRIIC